MANTFNIIEAILLIIVLTTVELCAGQGKLTSFSVLILGNPGNIPSKGNDVRLVCETEGIPTSIQITKVKDGKTLNISHGRQQSLEYLIQSVTCDDIGIYECDVDNTEQQTTDVVVSDCNPQSCISDDVTRTTYVDVNQSINFSMCVLAYPGLHGHAEFNNSRVRKKEMSSWSWDYTDNKYNMSSYGHFHINVLHDQMLENEYGRLNIRVFSSAGSNYYLDFNMWLLPTYPPECPTEIVAKDEGFNLVVLTWRPGFDCGSKQLFHIYFSKDNETWLRRDVRNSQTTVNMTGLEKDATYYFRVVSSNIYRTNVDETVCKNTISHKTEKIGSLTTWNSSIDGTANIIAPPISALIIVLAVVLVFVLYLHRVRNHSQTTQEEGEIQQTDKSQHLKLSDNTQLDPPGYYVSDEGLTYISLSHAKNKRKKKKARKKSKQKEEKIEYATLNFIQCGQVQVQEDIQKKDKK